MRPKALATLIVALLFALLAVAGGELASAQRRRAAQSNDNAAQAQTPNRQKRVFVGRGTDTAQGSRVSIKSDDTLKDYSAYRSGDRFYVVLPKTAAGAVSKGASGKGFSDMQVQQRGNDVVVSYRVQPGAKPRVEQKFNRLDVVFDVPTGAQANAGGNNAASGTTTPPANQTPNANASNQTSNRGTQSASTQNLPPGDKRGSQAASGAGQQGVGASTAATPEGTTEQPAGIGQTAPAGEQAPLTVETPAPTAPVEQQIARANPPGTIAPITTTNPATSAASGSTLGTYLLQNWWLALVIALVVIGLGLVFAARRTSATQPETIEESEASTTSAFEERRKKPLKDASTDAALSASETASVAALTPAVAAASTVSVRESKNARKKSKRKAGKDAKKKRALTEELAVVAEPPVETSAVEETAVEETVVEETVVAESAVAETAIEESAVEETISTEPVVAEPAVTEQDVAESVSEEPVVAETVAEEAVVAETVTEDVANGETTAEEVAVAFEGVGVEDAPVVEAAVVEASAVDEIVEETTQEIEPSEEVEAASSASTEITPAAAPVAPALPDVAHVDDAHAVALDPDNVQDEARHILQGEPYNEAVVGSSDSMVRQMIAAELLSALSGRNPERRARARAAFVKHGYFDEKLRDLSRAEAPAERAAAARSLALVGDRTATQNLIAALEDRSVDVRRAAVEALGELRDPSAIVPLESLLERERNQRDRIPPRVIRNVIVVCREAAEELRARPASDKPATLIETPQAEIPTPQESIAEAPPSAEPVEVAESATIETVANEPVVENTTVAIEPVVEDVTHVAEAAPIEPLAETTQELELFEPAHGDMRTIEPVAVEEVTVESAPVEDASAISAAEAMHEAPEESPVAVLEAQFYDEPNAFESPVAEPEAVVSQSDREKDIQPFVETDTTSIEFVEPSIAESRQATLFDEGATAAGDSFEYAEAPIAIPFESEGEGSAGIDDDWIELDVRETHFGERTPAIEPYNEYDLSSHVVETSPVETVSKEVVPSEEAREIEEDLSAFTPEEKGVEESFAHASDAVEAPVADITEKGVAPFDEFSTVPASIQQRLGSRLAAERAAAITELSHVDSDEAFQQICAAFDDEAKEVRSAAARALFDLRTDRADSFTRALREATPERRRSIGSAISGSGLAVEAISQLTGESREKTYEAFSLLFLMAKAGEVQPLIRAIEGHPNNEVRLAVVKLLALSGQKEILPAFRRLAVRGSLPTEVRSAVMEAIYQISSSQPSAA